MLCVRTTRRLAYAQDAAAKPGERYYLTSLSPTDLTPDELLELVRAHWLIENEVHHRKDRTLGEDAQRHRKGHVAASALRSTALGLLQHIAGPSTPAKQERLQATPRLALRLLHLKRKPRNLL